MKVYKALFQKNAIFCCYYVCDTVSDYSSSYAHHEDDKLTYAIIKAENEPHAYAIAETILNESLAQPGS
jgi:hypothetical protein